MLLQFYIPALSLAHGVVASTYARSYNHMLRSGREYSSPQIEVLAVSGQAMMPGQENNNNNNTVTTLDQANNNATDDTAELDPYARREAELEAARIEFSTYGYWEDPEGCPSLQPKCEDCGGLIVLYHRDVLNPSPRCSGLIDEDMKWKDCRCEDYRLAEFYVTPDMPLPDPDESEPDL